jgi:hypothetical protein
MIISGSAALFIMFSGVGATGLMATSSNNKKAGKSTPEKKESPKRKEFSKIRFSAEDLKKKRKPSYYLKIVKIRPDYELIFIESTPGTDGYGQRLFDYINNNNGFRDQGILMVVRRRVSKDNNSVLLNVRDGYPRRAIVRLVDTSSHESRLSILNALRAFLMLPENNKFGYEYIVNDTSNLTPDNAEDLEPMDTYIQDDMIVTIIVNVYEYSDQNWYNNNRTTALDFFGGPTFPQYAIDSLGYPPEGTGQNGIAHGFNIPP